MKTNAQLVSDWVAGYNAHDMEQLLRHVASDVAVDLAGGMMQFARPEQWTAHIEQEWSTFPDAEFEFAVVAEGENTVVGRGVWHATMLGDAVLPDGTAMPGNGGHTDLPIAFVFTFDDGTITEIAGYWNSMVAMSQLGLSG